MVSWQGTDGPGREIGSFPSMALAPARSACRMESEMMDGALGGNLRPREREGTLGKGEGRPQGRVTEMRICTETHRDRGQRHKRRERSRERKGGHRNQKEWNGPRERRRPRGRQRCREVGRETPQTGRRCRGRRCTLQRAGRWRDEETGWGRMCEVWPTPRRVGSQGIGLEPRKGLEQMEARETGTGEERTARRSGGREVDGMRKHNRPSPSENLRRWRGS